MEVEGYLYSVYSLLGVALAQPVARAGTEGGAEGACDGAGAVAEA